MASKPPAKKPTSSGSGLATLSTLVYSSEPGRVGSRTCPQCRQAQADCRCAVLQAAVLAGDGNVRVSRDSKGRGGKTVTLVRGLDLDAAALATLGQSLRNACGAGGSAKHGVLEVQGDHVERVMAVLTGEGWKVKRSGG